MGSFSWTQRDEMQMLELEGLEFLEFTIDRFEEGLEKNFKYENFRDYSHNCLKDALYFSGWNFSRHNSQILESLIMSHVFKACDSLGGDSRKIEIKEKLRKWRDSFSKNCHNHKTYENYVQHYRDFIDIVRSSMP